MSKNKIKPIKRNIIIGYMDERNAEIAKGLEEGEMIVVPTKQQ